MDKQNLLDEKLKEVIIKYNQGHLLEEYEKLNTENQISYINELKQINFPLISNLSERVKLNKKSESEIIDSLSLSEIFKISEQKNERLQEIKKIGFNLISNGQGYINSFLYHFSWRPRYKIRV